MQRSRFMIATAAALLAGAIALAARADFAGGRVGDPAPAATPSKAAPAPAASPDAAAQDLVSYLRKRDALKDTDIDGHVALAQWAAGREMWSQASDEARGVLKHDPDNKAAYKVLQQVDGEMQMPAEPKVEAALQAEFLKRFNRPFKTRNSRHFILCYDTTDAFAAKMGGSLEKSYEAFLAGFTMTTLRPQFLEHRLVVILFQNRTDYMKYAAETEGAAPSWMLGYYSPSTNRTAFYDDSTGEPAEDAEKFLATQRARLQELNTQIAQASSHGNTALAQQLTAQRNGLSDALRQADNMVGNRLAMSNVTKTSHEAAHQLAFNMGIQKRLADYPIWVSEGLACCFEVEDGAGHRGPTVLNWGRIDGVRHLLAEGKFVSVVDMVAAPHPKLDDTTLDVVYSEGWALFHYLYRTNRAGMEKYLKGYQGERAFQQLPPTEHMKLFTDAFGTDLESIDSGFRAYLKSLPLHGN